MAYRGLAVALFAGSVSSPLTTKSITNSRAAATLLLKYQSAASERSFVASGWKSIRTIEPDFIEQLFPDRLPRHRRYGPRVDFGASAFDFCEPFRGKTGGTVVGHGGEAVVLAIVGRVREHGLDLDVLREHDSRRRLRNHDYRPERRCAGVRHECGVAIGRSGGFRDQASAIGRIAGATVYNDANIAVDASDDASGAFFSKEGFIYVSEVEPKLDIDDSDKSMRGAKELNLWGSYVWGLYRSGAYGVEALFDASLPTS